MPFFLHKTIRKPTNTIKIITHGKLLFYFKRASYTIFYHHNNVFKFITKENLPFETISVINDDFFVFLTEKEIIFAEFNEKKFNIYSRYHINHTIRTMICFKSRVAVLNYKTIHFFDPDAKKDVIKMDFFGVPLKVVNNKNIFYTLEKQNRTIFLRKYEYKSNTMVLIKSEEQKTAYDIQMIGDHLFLITSEKIFIYQREFLKYKLEFKEKILKIIKNDLDSFFILSGSLELFLFKRGTIESMCFLEKCTNIFYYKDCILSINDNVVYRVNSSSFVHRDANNTEQVNTDFDFLKDSESLVNCAVFERETLKGNTMRDIKEKLQSSGNFSANKINTNAKTMPEKLIALACDSECNVGDVYMKYKVLMTEFITGKFLNFCFKDKETIILEDYKSKTPFKFKNGMLCPVKTPGLKINNQNDYISADIRIEEDLKEDNIQNNQLTDKIADSTDVIINKYFYKSQKQNETIFVIDAKGETILSIAGDFNIGCFFNDYFLAFKKNAIIFYHIYTGKKKFVQLFDSNIAAINRIKNFIYVLTVDGLVYCLKFNMLFEIPLRIKLKEKIIAFQVNFFESKSAFYFFMGVEHFYISKNNDLKKIDWNGEFIFVLMIDAFLIYKVKKEVCLELLKIQNNRTEVSVLQNKISIQMQENKLERTFETNVTFAFLFKNYVMVGIKHDVYVFQIGTKNFICKSKVSFPSNVLSCKENRGFLYFSTDCNSLYKYEFVGHNLFFACADIIDRRIKEYFIFEGFLLLVDHDCFFSILVEEKQKFITKMNYKTEERIKEVYLNKRNIIYITEDDRICVLWSIKEEIYDLLFCIKSRKNESFEQKIMNLNVVDGNFDDMVLYEAIKHSKVEEKTIQEALNIINQNDIDRE